MKTISLMVFNSFVLLLVIIDSARADEINADAGTSAIVLIVGVALLIAEVKRRPNRRSPKVDKQCEKNRRTKGRLASRLSSRFQHYFD